jgi:hypothetical protein
MGLDKHEFDFKAKMLAEVEESGWPAPSMSGL